MIPARDVDDRTNELAASVLEPLVLGGTITPVRPFGTQLALAIGERLVADPVLRARLDAARLRRARSFAPVDAVPPLGGGDWAMVAAFNDLLQVTNHELAGGLTRSRHLRLLRSVARSCERIDAPKTVRGVLARHATFANALVATRTDTLITWWSGKAHFRGQAPSKRLLHWQRLRRVVVEPRSVPLAEMCDGLHAVRADDFADVLTMWLSRSPLTDMAAATRKTPAFGWSASTLSLVASPSGRTLAWRALARHRDDLVEATLARALRELPAHFESARKIAEEFALETKENTRIRSA